MVCAPKYEKITKKAFLWTLPHLAHKLCLSCFVTVEGLYIFTNQFAPEKYTANLNPQSKEHFFSTANQGANSKIHFFLNVLKHFFFLKNDKKVFAS